MSRVCCCLVFPILSSCLVCETFLSTQDVCSLSVCTHIISPLFTDHTYPLPLSVNLVLHLSSTLLRKPFPPCFLSLGPALSAPFLSFLFASLIFLPPYGLLTSLHRSPLPAARRPPSRPPHIRAVALLPPCCAVAGRIQSLARAHYLVNY